MKSVGLCIIDWYYTHKRSLPWRDTKDPYTIWLSEIILQQTRVAQGQPYFNRFIKAFPTVKALSGASEEQVLSLWQGLGYYNRAQNMLRCARLVMQKFDGKFPTSHSILLSLPGIGPYTAAAISSLSDNAPVAVIDGNVYRVLSRYYGMFEGIYTSAGKKKIAHLANHILIRETPGVFNQAIMEFGALQCTPKNPGCVTCPLQAGCKAYQNKWQTELPVRVKKIKRKLRYFHYLIIRKQGKIVMANRRRNDIWKGLYEFYLIETSRAMSLPSLFSHYRELYKWYPTGQSTTQIHVLSHQKLRIKFIEVEPPTHWDTPISCRWYSYKLAKQLPTPVPIQKYLLYLEQKGW